MDFFDTIELKKESFTKADRKVWDAISKDYYIIFHNSSNSLAEKLHVSQASISRLCKKLGYSGYNEFRYALYDAVRAPQAEHNYASKADCTKRIIDLLYKQAENGEFDHLIDRLIESKYTITTGVHRSSLPARLMAIELTMSNRFSQFLANEEWTSVPNPGLKTTVICFSEQGESFRQGIELISSDDSENRPYTVLVCTNAKHPLRRFFDEVIWLPSSRNQHMPDRVEAVVIYSAFIDLILSMMMEKIQKEEETK